MSAENQEDDIQPVKKRVRLEDVKEEEEAKNDEDSNELFRCRFTSFFVHF